MKKQIKVGWHFGKAVIFITPNYLLEVLTSPNWFTTKNIIFCKYGNIFSEKPLLETIGLFSYSNNMSMF